MPVMQLLTVLLAGLALAALAIGLRFVIALARREDPREASRITTRNTVAVVGGGLTVLTVGLTALAEAGGGAVAWISAHPFAASNGALGLFGAVSSWAGIGIEPWQWVAVALIVPAAVLLIYEVAD